MEYEVLINKINSRIDNITLSKEEEKYAYAHQFIELYGDPKAE